jgi:hypothetical protein
MTFIFKAGTLPLYYSYLWLRLSSRLQQEIRNRSKDKKSYRLPFYFTFQFTDHLQLNKLPLLGNIKFASLYNMQHWLLPISHYRWQKLFLQFTVQWLEISLLCTPCTTKAYRLQPGGQTAHILPLYWMKVSDQLHTPTTISVGKGSCAMHSTGSWVGSTIADKTQMASISLNFELKNTQKIRMCLYR